MIRPYMLPRILLLLLALLGIVEREQGQLEQLELARQHGWIPRHKTFWRHY